MLTPTIDPGQDGDLVAAADARRTWTRRRAAGLPDSVAGTVKLPGMPDDRRQAFLDDLVSGTAAQLSLAPGIKVGALNAGNCPGLALHVAREALQAGQLQRILQRRFEQALVFEGCFVYLDAQGAMVIWHALPTPPGNLDRTLSRMLSLAGLSVLDPRSIR